MRPGRYQSTIVPSSSTALMVWRTSGHRGAWRTPPRYAATGIVAILQARFTDD
jgi:hypothetical protein